MQKIRQKRALAAILADIANLHPFLPGSIRKGGVQRHRNKTVEMAEYKAMPRLHYRRDGHRADRRFRESLWETMKELAPNCKKFKKLIAEFEEAALRENLPDESNKTKASGRRFFRAFQIRRAFRSRPACVRRCNQSKISEWVKF